MNDLISLNHIDRQAAVDALEDWEEKYTWDDWCRMHNDEKEKYNITAPSDVLKELPPATEAGMPAQEYRHKGKWIDDENAYPTGAYICSECHRRYYIPDAIITSKKTNRLKRIAAWLFCPMCGTEMKIDDD